MLVNHGPKCMQQAAIDCHTQEKTIDNRYPRNKMRIQSSINCNQMAP